MQCLLLFGAEALHRLRIQCFGLALDLLLDGAAGIGQRQTSVAAVGGVGFALQQAAFAQGGDRPRQLRLPGCVATGATMAEAESSLREAIVFHLDGMREDGLPIPAPASMVAYVDIAA